MKLLVDVCLSPDWVPFFEANEVHATHWSSVGPVSASDRLIFEYAIEHQMVIFTHDLDFGTILAHTRSPRPSVLQVRIQDPLPAVVGVQTLTVLRQFHSQFEEGSIVTLLPDRTRVRVLPL